MIPTYLTEQRDIQKMHQQFINYSVNSLCVFVIDAVSKLWMEFLGPRILCSEVPLPNHKQFFYFSIT